MLRALEELWAAAGDDRGRAAKKLGIKEDTLKRKLAGSRGFSVQEARRLARAYSAEVVVLRRRDAESLVRSGLQLSGMKPEQQRAFLELFRSSVSKDPPRQARTA